MKEYIEREALLRLIEENSETKFDWSESVDIDVLRPVILDMPAADVVPVVHGEWTLYPSDAYMKCSACGMEYLVSKMPHVVGYCPNCGADMRGAHKNA